MRINKYLAHRGLASRREVDGLIKAGQITVNGVAAVIGQQINVDDDVVIKNQAGQKTYLAYYKGRGIITHSPAPGEMDIATKLAHDFNLTGVSPIGRLDKDSEGLLLLSDDGRITGPLLDPEAKHEKEYEVMVDKPLSGMFLRALERGVNIEGYKTKPARATADPKNTRRFSLVLTEGKKHQIRRMCAALGYQVQTLKRVRIMNITLGKLKPNQFRKLTPTERDIFFKELGIK